MKTKQFLFFLVSTVSIFPLTGCEKSEDKASQFLSDYCSSFFSEEGEYQQHLYIHNQYPDDGGRLNSFQDKDGVFASQLKALVDGATFWKEVTSFDGNLSFGVFTYDPFFNPHPPICFKNCVFTVDLWTDQLLFVQSAWSGGLTSDAGYPTYVFHCDRNCMSAFQTSCEKHLKEVRANADRGVTE